MAQLMPLPLTISCSSNIQIGFTFLVPAHLGSPGKGLLNVCVCACARARVRVRVRVRVHSHVHVRACACECVRACVRACLQVSCNTCVDILHCNFASIYFVEY